MSYTFKVKQEILANEMITEIEKTAELSAVLLSKNALGKDKVELKLENLPLAKRVYKILKEITDLTIGIKYLTSRRLGEHNVYIITVQKQRGYRDFINKINISQGVISASEDILKGFIRGIFLACGYIKDPVKEYALEHNIPVYQPNSLKIEETQNVIKELNPDLIVVVAYGKILPKEIIDMPKYGVINVHSSLLPKYRGAAPINAALIHGEKESGVTIMYIAEELDAGDMILSVSTEIKDEDNFLTLHDRLKDLGAKALLKAVKLIEKEEAPRISQNHSEATFVKPFKKEDCKIDWNKSEREIFNFVRGMNPFPSAYTTLDDKIFKIYGVKENFRNYEEGTVGEIVDIKKGAGVIVKTGNGSVILTEVKPENKKLLNGTDIINGNVLKKGDKLN